MVKKNDQEKWRPEPAEPRNTEHVVYNNDGSRLGEAGGGGGGGRNPTAGIDVPSVDHPIGGSTGVLHELGQSREQHGGGGGAAPSDLGTSGWLDGDPGGHGLADDAIEGVSDEGPQIGHDRGNLPS